jgi:tryptophan-rich sensory protein
MLYGVLAAKIAWKEKSESMSMRSRKLIGTIALLLLVTVWALLAMALAQSILTSIDGLVATLYYVVAGLGWVLPAMPLVRWMSRPDDLLSSRPSAARESRDR